MRKTFVAVVVSNRYPRGKDTRVVKLYDLTPAQQAAAFAAAIVGYDEYHPDSKNPDGYKFPVPTLVKPA